MLDNGAIAFLPSSPLFPFLLSSLSLSLSLAAWPTMTKERKDRERQRERERASPLLSEHSSLRGATFYFPSPSSSPPHPTPPPQKRIFSLLLVGEEEEEEEEGGGKIYGCTRILLRRGVFLRSRGRGRFLHFRPRFFLPPPLERGKWALLQKQPIQWRKQLLSGGGKNAFLGGEWVALEDEETRAILTN